MKITISSVLEESDIVILSNAKWYQESIITFENWQEISNPNPQSRSDFIRQVYEWILIADATKIFCEYRSAQLKEQQRLLEEAVREWVISSITSVVE